MNSVVSLGCALQFFVYFIAPTVWSHTESVLAPHRIVRQVFPCCARVTEHSLKISVMPLHVFFKLLVSELSVMIDSDMIFHTRKCLLIQISC